MRKVVSVYLLILGLGACSDQQTGVAVVPPAAELPGARPGEEAISGTIAMSALSRGDAGLVLMDSVPMAPPLEGADANGEPFDLSKRRGERTLLIFYNTADCGLCTMQLRQLAATEDAFSHLDTRIVALTADPPEMSRQVLDIIEPGFPIVTIDRQTMARWAVWPEDEKRPRPAAFIIGPEGELHFIQLGRTAAERVSDVTLIFALQALDQPGLGSSVP